MLDRVNKLWDILCKPKPNIKFTIIDLEIEKLPDDTSQPIDLNIYFLT